MRRLPAPFGSRLDRTRPLRFTFEGRAIDGFVGDTIASALLANGESVLSRSFKYHRARGVLTMAGGEANTLVQLPGEPNVFADLRAAADGLEVRAQNVAGSLARDRHAILDRLGRFLPSG
ncbi:MAG: aminomethyltransferase, partial [Alphaproteobacteria bacterium]|nr:aminomethyltransferase [Alphaproteobacteria bacterium]